MKLPFKWYLHDDDESFNEHMQGELAAIGMSEPEIETLLQKIGRPFYEVTLYCSVDTETGEVEVLRFTL